MEPNPNQTAPTEPPSHRILVVDDNPSIHEDFRKILCPAQSQAEADLSSLSAEMFGESAPDPATFNFVMDSAFQGQEALAKVKAAELAGNPYSLAFMDVRMPPGWDGVETISRIWKEYPAIQIVICTAYSDYSWEEILRKLGETDSLVILKKPFENVEVLQLAHTLTKKWAVTRQASTRLADLDEAVKQRTRELVEANQQLQSEVQRRSHIESALRESEERFHKAFESVSVALSIRRADDDRYLDVNQSFLTLAGRVREEIIGRTPAELNFLADPQQARQLWERLSTGGTVKNCELVIKRKDGQIRQTLVSLEPLALGQQACLLSALLDVTDQKQLEGQLRQAQKMEAVGQLAAGVAHDFNNLLTVIHGYACLQLAKTNLDQDVAKAFDQVKMASERASALTRQLLAFSRKQVVRRRTINLSATLAHLQKMLARIVGETIQIDCHSPNALPLVLADESNLEQVIMNLVLNARDAMPGGGVMRLTAGPATLSLADAAGHPDRRPGEFVALTVTDNGCGMDEPTLARIFEPFFTTKPIGRGTGLGLSTVYGIVKQHEGWVEVQTKPGAGSTFRVFIPVAGQASHETTRLSRVNGTVTEFVPDAKDAILVVEDEPAVREYVASVLAQNGYQVEQASSGADALARWSAQTRKILLLVTDMVMPGGVSGSALARQLLRSNPALKVIYTSGYSADAIVNGEVLREGLNFLPKPFTQERLLSTISNALHASSPGVELTLAAAN